MMALQITHLQGLANVVSTGIRSSNSLKHDETIVVYVQIGERCLQVHCLEFMPEHPLLGRIVFFLKLVPNCITFGFL